MWTNGIQVCSLISLMTNTYAFYCFSIMKMQGLPPSPQPRSPAPPGPPPSPQPPETQQSAQVGSINLKYSLVIADVHPFLFSCKATFVWSSFFGGVAYVSQKTRRCLRRFDGSVWREAACSRRSKPWSSSSRVPSLPWERYCTA